MTTQKRASLERYYNQLPGTIEGLIADYSRSVASIDVVNYHLWVPRDMNADDIIVLKEQFKKAARQKSGPVSFSWDWIPSTYIQEYNGRHDVVRRSDDASVSKGHTTHRDAWLFQCAFERTVK